MGIGTEATDVVVDERDRGRLAGLGAAVEDRDGIARPVLVLCGGIGMRYLLRTAAWCLSERCRMCRLNSEAHEMRRVAPAGCQKSCRRRCCAASQAACCTCRRPTRGSDRLYSPAPGRQLQWAPDGASGASRTLWAQGRETHGPPRRPAQCQPWRQRQRPF